MTDKFYRVSADEFREKACEPGFILASPQHGVLDGDIYVCSEPVGGLPEPISGQEAEVIEPVQVVPESTPAPWADRVRNWFSGH